MKGRVLLVEDEVNIFEAISFILSRDGWEVHGHGNGATALAEIARQAPDVLVLDVMLPGKSGFDILQEIRADGELATMPVLMLTARGQVKDRELAEQSGVSRYMTKPFSNADVLEVVRSMVAT